MSVRPPSLRLPHGWKQSVRVGVLHAISLARYALTQGRGRLVRGNGAWTCHAAEIDRRNQEIALLREELRIKDARMASLHPHRRPHYGPTERMAILDYRATRGWNLAQTAAAFLVTTGTIREWMKRLDEQGPNALVQLREPVNKFPDFVGYLVRRLRTLCPTVGKRKIAETLARAGLHLAATTVGRMHHTPPRPKLAERVTRTNQPRVRAKRPNDVWHCDLSVVPIVSGLWTAWLPNALPQCWPFCWWIAVVVDHYSRRVMGANTFLRQPTSEQVRAFIGRTIHSCSAAPKLLICDRGPQFDCHGIRAWFGRKGIQVRYGAVGRQGSIAIVERCIRTFKEVLRQILFIPMRREVFRKELHLIAQWYNAMRPKKRIVLKAEERDRLLKLGAALGSKLKHLITIVGYDTYLRWQRNKRENKPVKKMGRPKTPDEVRALILKLASETGWGYTRIMGELAKLGIKPPSKTTVQNILREGGHDPGPKRGKGTWEEFLKAHAETLWQCDFFSKRVLTRTGFKQAFVMAFINVATRRVIISPSTFKLGDGWIVRQTTAFFEQAQNAGLEAKLIMRDNDANYDAGFDEAVNAGGAQVRLTAIRAPNENAYIERFVQSIKQECLDHFLVFGQDHLDYLVREYVRYYHDCRPHQGIGNRLIRASNEAVPVAVGPDQVRCESRLGGVLKTYVWAA